MPTGTSMICKINGKSTVCPAGCAISLRNALVAEATALAFTGRRPAASPLLRIEKHSSFQALEYMYIVPPQPSTRIAMAGSYRSPPRVPGHICAGIPNPVRIAEWINP